ncbi:MAG: hypothetical protein LBH29_01130, partial [Elusimicrobiota bacterium]|nr:hypothetical protein [Elusimicrobiota bacterium]
MKKFYRYSIIALAIISLVYVVSDMTLSKYHFTPIPPQYKLDIERVAVNQSNGIEQTLEKTR